MRKEKLVRLSAPGLPPFPKLLFDPERRWALVTARHPIWESYLWANWATMALVVACVVGAAWQAWNRSAGVAPGPRLFVIALAVVTAMFVARIALPVLVRDFLARRVFATKTSVLFTPEAISLRSRRYRRAVLLWRLWRGKPVNVSFTVSCDAGAQEFDTYENRRKIPGERLRTASVLDVVVASVDRHRNPEVGAHDSLMRSIPISEIDGPFAEQFTMVCAAALGLTDAGFLEDEARVVGADIDAIYASGAPGRP